MISSSSADSVSKIGSSTGLIKDNCGVRLIQHACILKIIQMKIYKTD
jgi:hypothetical protein